MIAKDDAAKWRKSSYSGGGNNCVEVAIGRDRVKVRHSRHPEAARLAFSPDAWRAFIEGVKAGEFDL